MRNSLLSLVLLSSLFVPLEALGASSVWSKAPLPDQLEFVALLEGEEFESLERKFHDLERKFESGDRDDYHLLHVYQAFTHAKPEFGVRIGAWVDAYPNSHVARVAEGQYFGQLARLISRNLSNPATPKSERRKKERRLRRAVGAYRAALKIKPDQLVAHVGLIRISGAVSGDSNAKDLALEPPLESPHVLFSNALQVLPDMPSLYEIYLSNFLGTGAELRQFREATKRRFADNPAFRWLEAQPHRRRAGVFFRSGDLAAASHAYKEALKVFENSWGRISLGNTLLRLKRFDEARSNFFRALAINPNRAMAHFGIAGSFMAEKRTAKALYHLDQAIAQGPYRPDILLRRVWALIAMDRFDLAKKDIDRAMVYGRFDYDVHFYDGYIKRQGQEWDAAIAAFRKATELGPESPRNWRYLAAAQASVGSCEAIDTIWTYTELCRQLEYCAEDPRHLGRVAASLDCDKALPTW